MSTNRRVAISAGSRSGLRIGGTLAVAGVLAVLSAAPAAAHVHAEAPDATQGGYGKITFRVPNEQDDAGTIKVVVDFPADTPVGSASIQPVPGWTSKVAMKSLAKPVKQGESQLDEAVSTVTWTAKSGVRINPGEFQEFAVSAGPLPSGTDELLLPATQTYDNGEVVRWEQPTEPGQPEPERPAPSIALAAADTGSGHGAPAATGADADAGHSRPEAAAAGMDDTARWLGGAGLIVGALGLGLGAGAILRSRKPGKSGGGAA